MNDPTVVILQYGLAGVVILAESAVIINLWKKVQALYDALAASQEARRVDALQTSEKTTQLANNVTQAMTLFGNKIDSPGGRDR